MTNTEKFVEKLIGEDGNGCAIVRLAIASLRKKGFKFTPHKLNEYDIDYTHHLPDIMEEARNILNTISDKSRCQYMRKQYKPSKKYIRSMLRQFKGFLRGYTNYEK